jgi:hypothetical protein
MVMTVLKSFFTTVGRAVKTYFGHALKVAFVVGTTCALLGEVVLPALGAAGISLPTWVAVSIGAVGGIAAALQRWAAENNFSAKVVFAKLTGR